MESNEEDLGFRFPLFFKCSLEQFEALNNQANELLKLPNEGTENYAKPIIDKNKDCWFLVNQDTSELVDLNKCVVFEKIIF